MASNKFLTWFLGSTSPPPSHLHCEATYHEMFALVLSDCYISWKCQLPEYIGEKVTDGSSSIVTWIQPHQGAALCCLCLAPFPHWACTNQSANQGSLKYGAGSQREKKWNKKGVQTSWEHPGSCCQARPVAWVRWWAGHNQQVQAPKKNLRSNCIFLTHPPTSPVFLKLAPMTTVW